MTYQPAPDRYDSMVYRTCGRSGLQLPVLSLGLWHNFGDTTPMETQKAIVRTAFDAGITHMDLANNYGPPYGSAEINFGRILREDLAAHRDELIISSKAGWDMWPGPYGQGGGSRKYVLASLDQSLTRIGVDYVDIFYSHRFDPDTPLAETMGALAHAVRAGKALYVGISSYSAAKTREAAALLAAEGVPLLIHQPAYNLFNRWVEPELLDALEEVGAGMIAFTALAQGLLTDKYLDGIPANARVNRPGGDSFPREALSEDNLARVRALNEIAKGRGQTPRPDGLCLGPARSPRDHHPHRGAARPSRSARTWGSSPGSSSRPTSWPRSTGTRRRAASTSGRSPAPTSGREAEGRRAPTLHVPVTRPKGSRAQHPGRNTATAPVLRHTRRAGGAHPERARHMNLKAIAAVGLIAVGAGAVAITVLGVGGSQGEAVTYRTAQAALTNVQQTAAASGSLAAATVYDLAFGETPTATDGTSATSSSTSSAATAATGATTAASSNTGTGDRIVTVTWPVTAVNVSVGDLVKAGDVLAVADDTSAELAVRQAEANLAAAKAQKKTDAAGGTATSRAQAKDQVTSAKTQLSNARSSYSSTVAQNNLKLRQARQAVTDAKAQYKSRQGVGRAPADAGPGQEGHHRGRAEPGLDEAPGGGGQPPGRQPGHQREAVAGEREPQLQDRDDLRGRRDHHRRRRRDRRGRAGAGRRGGRAGDGHDHGPHRRPHHRRECRRGPGEHRDGHPAPVHPHGARRQRDRGRHPRPGRGPEGHRRHQRHRGHGDRNGHLGEPRGVHLGQLDRRQLHAWSSPWTSRRAPTAADGIGRPRPRRPPRHSPAHDEPPRRCPACPPRSRS